MGRGFWSSLSAYVLKSHWPQQVTWSRVREDEYCGHMVKASSTGMDEELGPSLQLATEFWQREQDYRLWTQKGLGLGASHCWGFHPSPVASLGAFSKAVSP